MGEGAKEVNLGLGCSWAAEGSAWEGGHLLSRPEHPHTQSSPHQHPHTFRRTHKDTHTQNTLTGS